MVADAFPFRAKGCAMVYLYLKTGFAYNDTSDLTHRQPQNTCAKLTENQ
jgi:hypothetical protein